MAAKSASILFSQLNGGAVRTALSPLFTYVHSAMLVPWCVVTLVSSWCRYMDNKKKWWPPNFAVSMMELVLDSLQVMILSHLYIVTRHSWFAYSHKTDTSLFLKCYNNLMPSREITTMSMRSPRNVPRLFRSSTPSSMPAFLLSAFLYLKYSTLCLRTSSSQSMDVNIATKRLMHRMWQPRMSMPFTKALPIALVVWPRRRIIRISSTTLWDTLLPNCVQALRWSVWRICLLNNTDVSPLYVLIWSFLQARNRLQMTSTTMPATRFHWAAGFLPLDCWLTEYPVWFTKSFRMFDILSPCIDTRLDFAATLTRYLELATNEDDLTPE